MKPRGLFFTFLILGFMFVASSHANAEVSCAPVWTEPTTHAYSVTNVVTISGTVTFSFTPNCTGGTFADAVLYVGCQDSQGQACSNSAYFSGPIEEGPVSSFQVDTTTIPNGPHDFGLNLYDSSGNIVGGDHPNGIDMDQALTVQNGAAPVTTPSTPSSSTPSSSTPTPAPSPVSSSPSTSSGGSCVTFISPGAGSTVRGIITISLSENCAGAVFNRFYVGNMHYDFGGTTYQWDTTTLPNGTYALGLIAWNGFVNEGTAMGGPVTISN
jgi:hypothetical protein